MEEIIPIYYTFDLCNVLQNFWHTVLMLDCKATECQLLLYSWDTWVMKNGKPSTPDTNEALVKKNWGLELKGTGEVVVHVLQAKSKHP